MTTADHGDAEIPLLATVESGDANGTTVRVRREAGGAWLMVSDPANLEYVEVWLDADKAGEVAAALDPTGE